MQKTESDSAIKMDNPDIWVDRYGDFLYRFALARVKDTSIAEDLVQETFLAALRARENFQGRSAPKTWLVAILKHKIVDHIRKSVREQSLDSFDSVDKVIEDAFDDRGEWKVKPRSWTINPMKILEQKEFMAILYRCLAELPSRLSRAFMMREIDGLDTEEICKVLDISATNSWVMLYRARMGLRSCLEDKWLNVGN
jgi:RNA polymerase sigma-70 factor (ECF subfamily)